MPRHFERRRAQPAQASGASSGLAASKLRLLGVAVICAKVALVPLVFDPASDVPFGPSKALLSHALAYVIAGVILGLFIQFGRAILVWSPVHIPVLVFLGVNAIATAFAADVGLALYGTHGRMLGLATIADWVVLYFGVALLVRTRTEILWTAGAALGASVVVLAYEAVQLLGKDPFTWNMDGAVRPFSTVGQPTTLGEYLTVLAIGTAGAALLIERMARRLRGAMLLFAFLLLAAAAETATRSPVVGALAGAAALVLLVWVQHPDRGTRLIAAAGAGFAVVALGLLVISTPLGARLSATIAPPPGDDPSDDPLSRLDASSDTRLALYTIAFDMVRERPLLGYGPDNFVVGIPTYRPENAPYEVRQSLTTSAHSWVAQIATNSGILGLLAFIAISVTSTVVVFRTGFRPFALVATAMLGAFLGTALTTISEIGTDWLFWFSAGLVVAATGSTKDFGPSAPVARRPKRSKAPIESTSSELRRAASWLCAAGGLVLAFTIFNALAASHLIKSAEVSRLHGSPAQAVSSALAATRSDPGRAEYWHGLGLAYAGASDLRESASAFKRAVQLAPYDATYIGDLAVAMIMLDRAGDPGARDQAIAIGEQAVRTDPNNPRANLTRAIVMQVTGNLPEATRSVERAIALDPQSSNPRLYLTATQVYLSTGRTADAASVARLGIALVWPPLSSVDLRVELARALVAAGQPTDALAQLDAALAILPNYPVAVQLRSQIRSSIQSQ